MCSTRIPRSLFSEYDCGHRRRVDRPHPRDRSRLPGRQPGDPAPRAAQPPQPGVRRTAGSTRWRSRGSRRRFRTAALPSASTRRSRKSWRTPRRGNRKAGTQRHTQSSRPRRRTVACEPRRPGLQRSGRITSAPEALGREPAALLTRRRAGAASAAYRLQTSRGGDLLYCEKMSLMKRFVDRGRRIVLVPFCLGLLTLDVLIARRAIVVHRQQAEYDAELARLNERLRCKPKEPQYEPEIFTVF